MRRRSACWSASAARSMSALPARARPQTTARLTRLAISETASKSPFEAIGKPASMMSTPISSRSSATCSFCSSVIDAPGGLLAVAQRGVEDDDAILAGGPPLSRCSSWDFLLEILARRLRSGDCPAWFSLPSPECPPAWGSRRSGASKREVRTKKERRAARNPAVAGAGPASSAIPDRKRPFQPCRRRTARNGVRNPSENSPASSQSAAPGASAKHAAARNRLSRLGVAPARPPQPPAGPPRHRGARATPRPPSRAPAACESRISARRALPVAAEDRLDDGVVLGEGMGQPPEPPRTGASGTGARRLRTDMRHLDQVVVVRGPVDGRRGRRCSARSTRRRRRRGRPRRRPRGGGAARRARRP
jgi:hypothetical protein